MSEDTKAIISNEFRSVYSEILGVDAPELSDSTILLDTGMDSLGFAILVARLEIMLGIDPFTASEDAYYPRTFGEFVRFYQSMLK